MSPSSLAPRRPASAIAPARPRVPAPKANPKVGFVSLGCPKALVDSERILTRLRAEGYDTVGSHGAADVVIVNTCGFIDSAVTESLDAIGQAMTDNGRVIVTGCLGKKAEVIRARFPDVLSISGPQDFSSVMDAVHTAVPPVHEPFVDLLPPQGIKLTPRHYAYLKIAEGCNQKCSFCIIPSMRGKLASRPVDEVLKEAERLARAGVRELLVISQDTGAYGSDLRYAPGTWRGREWAARITDLALGLSELGVWVRMHYLYPYPHLDGLLPLMAEGKVLPYMDVPFQHASPRILKLMRRPAAAENTLARVKAWQQAVPGLAIRSTFIVGFPGETEAEFRQLLDFLEEAKLAHAGCFAYSPVEGAPANLLPDHVSPEVQEERRQRFMETQARISRARLTGLVGQTLDVLIDEATPDRATGRTYADAPEIDGTTEVRAAGLTAGQMVRVRITQAGDYDLAGVLA